MPFHPHMLHSIQFIHLFSLSAFLYMRWKCIDVKGLWLVGRIWMVLMFKSGKWQFWWLIPQLSIHDIQLESLSSILTLVCLPAYHSIQKDCQYIDLWTLVPSHKFFCQRTPWINTYTIKCYTLLHAICCILRIISLK